MTRRPERRAELLDLLAKEWETVPDQRLGQLLLNLTRRNGVVDQHALWNTEDDDLIAQLRDGGDR